MSLFIIRPVQINDYDRLLAVLQNSGPGLTNIPSSEQPLKDKITRSVAAFSKNSQQIEDDLYFFVLEERATGHIAGICAIQAQVGVKQPFYSLRVLNLTHTSTELKHYEPVRVLQMVEEHRGCAEVMMLYLDPQFRQSGNAKLLSFSRMLFMHQHSTRFPRDVIAEMRGNVNEKGQSAFWDNLGGRFIPLNFIDADQFNALGNYQFIADLMPKHPIYVRLLSNDAQAMIGKTHPQTTPAIKMLEREGFRHDGCIDVFDAGPLLSCPVEQLRAAKESCTMQVSSITDINGDTGKRMILANTRFAEYRCTLADIILEQDQLSISTETAQALNVSVGDSVVVYCL